MDSLNDIRVSVLGKKGELSGIKRNEGRSQEDVQLLDRWSMIPRAVIEESIRKRDDFIKEKSS